MALKPCKECKTAVSTGARVCPHCGLRNPTGGITTGAWLGMTLIGLCIGLYGLSTLMGDDGRKERAQARAATPPETDADVLVRNTKEAPYAAKQVLASRFKAPSQVEYSDRKLLLQQNNFALSSVVVDAPNPFGVKLRSKWCYILEYKPPRGREFAWSDQFGVWKCQGEVDASDLLVREAAVGWPGAQEVLAAEAKKAPAKRR